MNARFEEAVSKKQIDRGRAALQKLKCSAAAMDISLTPDSAEESDNVGGITSKGKVKEHANDRAKMKATASTSASKFKKQWT